MPADVGFYYAFGEVEPKESYDEESQKFKDSDAQITDYYKVGTSDIAGNASYDAAAKNWGKNWRMKTKALLTRLEKKSKNFLKSVLGNSAARKIPKAKASAAMR